MFFEILRSTASLVAIAPPLAWWELRVATGWTEGDIKHGAVLVAGCAALVAFPIVRGEAVFAASLFHPPKHLIDRFLSWAEGVSLRIHGEWWFKVTRLLVLVGWMLAGVWLLATLPPMQSQDRSGYTTREILRDHQEQIRQMQQAMTDASAAQAELRREVNDLKAQQAKLMGWLENFFQWTIGGGLALGVKMLVWDTFSAGVKYRISGARARKEDEETEA